METAAVLDAYTSVFSNDLDGEMAELYFTNSGLVLLALSLASSVAMNLLLPTLALHNIRKFHPSSTPHHHVLMARLPASIPSFLVLVLVT